MWHQPHNGNDGLVAEWADGSVDGPWLDALHAKGVPSGIQPRCISQRAQADGAGLFYGASTGSSWCGLLMVPVAAPVWRCLSSLGSCSNDNQVSSISGPRHLPCGLLAELQRLVANQQHLDTLHSTRKTLMPCPQPEGSQHLTCHRKDWGASPATQDFTSLEPQEGP